MNDLPISATTDAVTPAGDPELAALVRPKASPNDAGSSGAVIESVAPRGRRRGLVLRFGISFLIGCALAVGIGAGALYALDLQYEGRVLPGVSVGSTDLSGLTRVQSEWAIATAYGSLGKRQITLTDPDGQKTTITYADLGRGPDTQALVNQALAAGRVDAARAHLRRQARPAIHGVTFDSAVVYDHDKLLAAVEAQRTKIDQTPT